MEKKWEKKVKFKFPDKAAGKVAVTGDFNSWDENGIALRRKKDGSWQKEINLKPGKYQYKFIVDGQWLTDPLNETTAPNQYGSENSVKEVS